jgi:acetylxylan esterase
MKFYEAAVGLLALTGSALGASLQAVTNFGTNPTGIQMFIYVPDKVAAKPAIIVAVCSLPCIPLKHTVKSLST